MAWPSRAALVLAHTASPWRRTVRSVALRCHHEARASPQSHVQDTSLQVRQRGEGHAACKEGRDEEHNHHLHRAAVVSRSLLSYLRVTRRLRGVSGDLQPLSLSLSQFSLGCALQVPQSSANRATDTAIRLSIRRPAPGVPTHGSSSPPASSGPAPPPRPGTRRQHASAHPAPLAPFFAQSEVGAAVLLNDGRAKAGQRTIFQ